MTKNTQILRSYQALSSLTLHAGITQDPAIQQFQRIIEQATLDEQGTPERLLGDYHHLATLLLEAASTKNLPPAGTLWENHLLNIILLQDHLYARQVALGETTSPFLEEAFLHDLRHLQTLCQEGAVALKEFFKRQTGLLPLSLPTAPQAGGCAPGNLHPAFAQLKGLLLSSNSWHKHLDAWQTLYSQAGVGIFARYRAFRWERVVGDYTLLGIENPDPQRLEQLVGYERQRQQVLDNTRRLISGKPTHNLLLYGDRGTGKSSTVKALLHEFAHQGLRLVQISRQDLAGLQRLTSYLSHQPGKFIVFIDDLSFEDTETEYKELKTQLEGSLEQHPANVCIYVTSNQRNLIKEYFDDRKTKELNGEVHPGDTLQEKLSLADRFGLKITYLAPDKQAFLEIVRQLAVQEHIPLAGDQLEKMALKWTLWHNERSGRTARQFIDYLKDREDWSLLD